MYAYVARQFVDEAFNGREWTESKRAGLVTSTEAIPMVGKVIDLLGDLGVREFAIRGQLSSGEIFSFVGGNPFVPDIRIGELHEDDYTIANAEFMPPPYRGINGIRIGDDDTVYKAAIEFWGSGLRRLQELGFESAKRPKPENLLNDETPHFRLIAII